MEITAKQRAIYTINCMKRNKIHAAKKKQNDAVGFVADRCNKTRNDFQKKGWDYE